MYIIHLLDDENDDDVDFDAHYGDNNRGRVVDDDSDNNDDDDDDDNISDDNAYVRVDDHYDDHDGDGYVDAHYNNDDDDDSDYNHETRSHLHTGFNSDPKPKPNPWEGRHVPGNLDWPGKHRGNTSLTSRPFVSVRRHGRVTQWRSRWNLTASASCFPCAQHMLQQMLLTNLSEVSRLSSELLG